MSELLQWGDLEGDGCMFCVDKRALNYNSLITFFERPFFLIIHHHPAGGQMATAYGDKSSGRSPSPKAN